ncbi:MAG: hypothetical protein JXR69_00865 [Candidatus Delongbacteria bacterium]|nr:hypothetical protein [Candidatus Delongbacteria bacterium]
MKISILSLFVILSFSSLFADYYSGGFAETLLLGRRPNARYEAMGKTGVAEDGYLYTGLLNPACIGGLEGLSINYSYDPASFYFIDDDAWYSDYYGFGLNYKDFSFYIDYYRQCWGEMTHTDEFGNLIDTYQQVHSLLNFNSSYKISNTFYLGFGLRYANWDFYPVYNDDWSCYLFDLGLLKKFEVYSNSNSKYIMNIGASLSNILNSKVSDDPEEHAPRNLRFGVSNNFIFKDPNLSKITISSEFYKILNSYHSGEDDFSFNNGLEVTMVQYFILRCGYYYQLNYDYDNSYNKDHLSEFTYGLGLILPINEIFNNNLIPLSFSFDLTMLDQPSYTKDSNWDDFYNLSFTLNWKFEE